MSITFFACGLASNTTKSFFGFFQTTCHVYHYFWMQQFRRRGIFKWCRVQCFQVFHRTCLFGCDQNLQTIGESAHHFPIVQRIRRRRVHLLLFLMQFYQFRSPSNGIIASILIEGGKVPLQPYGPVASKNDQHRWRWAAPRGGRRGKIERGNMLFASGYQKRWDRH